MPAGAALWVVATPIGNLSDLSPRGREALAGVSKILCEDTRRTSQLMSALGLQRRLERFDAHTSDRELESWIERLLQGEALAIVTDAGTPAISDPGARLVREAHERGIRVLPVPGPSAPVTLLSASGFHETAFCFRGFFPRKKGDRLEELRQASASSMARVFVWFESPNRIIEALEAVAEVEPNSRLCVGKELTKLHERVFSGQAGDVLDQVRAEIEKEGALGEWCFAVELKPQVEEKLGDWELALQCLVDCRVGASEAAKRVSQRFGVAKNQAYERALMLSGKK